MSFLNTTHILAHPEHPILLDATYIPNQTPKPVIVFAHGFKGYKDWGAWQLLANYFAEKGFVFVKFNFSHNGGTLENPIDFPDLEKFAQNTYTRQLDDLQRVIDFMSQPHNKDLAAEIDTQNLYLTGHSLGGNLALLHACKDKRIRKLVTLAAVCDLKSRLEKHYPLDQWKADGVVYVANQRTQQQMPLNYTLYQDVLDHQTELSAQQQLPHLNIPWLLIHGEEDAAVPLAEAQKLKTWHPKAHLKIIHETGHTFDAKHPWQSSDLPNALAEVAQEMVEFFQMKH